ncbi:proteasome subunit beta type-1 isoform X1 [Panulirus ornatus]|uniref:proteasome subunit beta type-1 isoform X1 n=2 Tax=Panulirus ornatus TaxID=150431 RepID=UPI003A867DAF
MSLDVQSKPDYMRDPRKHHFFPYADNGGTSVAIAGDDFVMMASDTRLSRGFNIFSREQGKVFELTPKTMMASSGCWADVLTLNKVLQARLTMYAHEHHDVMSTTAVAQLLSTMLYWRRFFPYYVSNILAGLEEDGKGVVYHYDPVGHMEKLTFSATGASVAQIQPLLDNQIGGLNMQGVTPPKMTKELARQLIHDAFVSAAERDINTGDGIILYTVTKEGKTEEMIKLRRD